MIDHARNHGHQRTRHRLLADGQPQAASTAFWLQPSLTDRGLYGVGKNGSWAGSHCVVSIPLRMPTRSLARRRMPSKEPELGRLDFLAYFRLTVVMMSESTMPLQELMRPQYSSPAP